MKKAIIAITIAAIMAATPAMAQVFLDDEETNTMRDGTGTGTTPPGVYTPEQDSPNDQYTPVGEGILLLAGLAGAYLIGKRRKEE